MGDLSCGTKCMKYLLFLINLLFFLLGGAALGLGIWALVDKNKMNVLTKVNADSSDFNVVGLLESSAITLLVGGGVILLIGFLGCWGACKQSKCLLCLYGFLLILVLLIQIAAIVIAAIFKGKVEDEMKTFLKKNINSTYDGKIATAEEFSLGLDYAQVFFKCCGVDSYTEFQGATKWNKTVTNDTDMVIPPSCCMLKNVDEFYDEPSKAKLKEESCPVAPTATNSNQNTPCWDSIEKYLVERIYIVIGIAAGIVALEVICLIFACCLIKALRKDGE